MVLKGIGSLLEGGALIPVGGEAGDTGGEQSGDGEEPHPGE